MGRFQDRIVQYPNRRKMKVLDENGNTISEAIVELTRYEGTVSQEGTVLNASALNSLDDVITQHINNQDNPHLVTKAQVGLGNVKNVDTTNASNITTGTLPSSVIPVATSDKIGGIKIRLSGSTLYICTDSYSA